MGSKKPRNSIAPLRRKPSRPTDWDALLGQFSEGLSLFAVARKALAQGDIANDEQACLSAASKLLNGAYNALDAAIVEMTP
jgi:hypothetical protein